MSNRGQGKDDFVSTLAESEGAAASLRAEGTVALTCGRELDVRFANKRKGDAGSSLDAPSGIHNLKYTPLDRRRLLT